MLDSVLGSSFMELTYHKTLLHVEKFVGFQEHLGQLVDRAHGDGDVVGDSDGDGD